MKIISWNVNGIRAVIKKGFYDFIDEHNPDVLCIQEIKANEEQVDLILSDYPYKYWNSAEKKGYSGVAVYSKTEPIDVMYEIGSTDLDKEGRTLILDFGSFVLFNIYYPNGKDSPARLEPVTVYVYLYIPFFTAFKKSFISDK